MTFSYDGTNFNGYQKQKGLNTIQGKMEEALEYINNHKYIVALLDFFGKMVYNNRRYLHKLYFYKMEVYS